MTSSDMPSPATDPADVSGKAENGRMSQAEAARRLLAGFTACDCGCGECYQAPAVFEGQR